MSSKNDEQPVVPVTDERDSPQETAASKYRRKQLERLQTAVIDMEDLSSGISITDLTLSDFRVELADFMRAHTGVLEHLHPGAFAVTSVREMGDVAVPPGVIFCLQAVDETLTQLAEPGYPLAPYYLVHVGDDGAVLLPYTQAKQVLDRLRRAALGKDLPDAMAMARFDKKTRTGADMGHVQGLLSKAVASILGKREERAVASLFSPGGTYAQKGEFAGSNAFEVVAFLVVLTGE